MSRLVRLQLPLIHFRKNFFHSTGCNLKIIPFLLADIGEGITECEIVQWFVKPGERVEQFSKICEVQSDKAAVEITSRYDGVIKELKYNVGQVAKVGSPLVDIDVEEDEPVETETRPIVANLNTKNTSEEHKPLFESKSQANLATPAVRRIAKENRLNLNDIKGTGPKGRILKGDILNLVEKVLPKHHENDLPVPLNSVQKAMFKSMTKSLLIPHFGYSEEIILNETSKFRRSFNASIKAQALDIEKISYMPIFIKALSLALKKYPIFNAQLVNEDDSQNVGLHYRKEHHIGVAMDTNQGLFVPNIKNVENLSILDIARELARLRECGKRGAFSPQDLKGGTITLSNIGTIGGLGLHPVIVQGQVCIGGIGKIQTLPRFAEGSQIVASEIMSVSFNADHRIIDGASMARFVKYWKDLLEQPYCMTIDMK